jgi:hypothetical protein
MATGTSKVIGFLMASQRPLDEHYLNEGVAWASTGDALAGIPLGSRSPYKLLNIAGALYWFKADLTTLEAVTVASMQGAADVAIEDIALQYAAENVEDALAEVMAAVNSIIAEIGGFSGVIQQVYRIDLGAGTLAARIAAAVEVTNYPLGWVLSQDGSGLLITHTLTGRKISGINIYEIDGTEERLLVPFYSAYSGVVGGTLSVLIEGIAPTTLPIRIELLFS